LDSRTCSASLRTWFEIQLDAIAQSIAVIMQEVDNKVSHVFPNYIILPEGQMLTVPACKQSYAAVSIPSQTDLLWEIRLHSTSSHQSRCWTQVCLLVTTREPIQLSILATSTFKTGAEFGMQSNMQCEPQDRFPRSAKPDIFCAVTSSMANSKKISSL